MGDEKTLTAKLEALMEQMVTRQQILGEQVTILSLLVQKITKGDSEKNNEEQGSSRGRKRNSDSQHGGCMVPQYSKMKFPTYDGVGDPLGRFGPPMSNNPLGELANLRQTGTVEEYQCQFLSQLARTTDLKPRQKVNLSTAELVEERRIDIEMQQQENLGVAMNMARILEQLVNHHRSEEGGCIVQDKKCDYFVELLDEEEPDANLQYGIRVSREIGENVLPTEFKKINFKRSACYFGLEMVGNGQ
ncbi:hypothetical protein GOBAR_DD08084 [Gossypium barbadense]|nr:hypothetical protein GOBAR_DD08084 [Gossypium barbadense]